MLPFNIPSARCRFAGSFAAAVAFSLAAGCGGADITDANTPIKAATAAVDVAIENGEVKINGTPLDPNAPDAAAAALIAVLGPPDRTTSSPDVMTWDAEGIYARGTETRLDGIAAVYNNGPYQLPFRPTSLFSGTFVVNGTPAGPTLEEDATVAIEAAGVDVFFSAWTDGRETEPTSGAVEYVEYEGF